MTSEMHRRQSSPAAPSGSRRGRARTGAVLVLALALLSTHAADAAPSPGVHEDAKHFEAYFSSGDDTLHADVLRPKALPDKAKTPVIMTVSPYTNHSGDPTEPGFTREGPHHRFRDFLDLSNALKRGYTHVMVDLPGFGGSSGCNDFGGVREQRAIVAAVEWAAGQPWSNGKVGLIGMSYDAWTGVIGASHEPKGLAAVLAMEPVFDGYNYHYNNGVRFIKSVATPAQFQVYDAKPGTVNDTPQYHANGAPEGYCYGENLAVQQIDDPDHPYWVERRVLPRAAGSKVPVFMTQGFLEINTKPDQAYSFFNSLGGRENRAWLGQIDHVRSWNKTADGKRTQTGRPVQTFVGQVMAFFDEHLMGRGDSRPGVEVQDSLGKWRSEPVWPPADGRVYRTALNTGLYKDNAGNVATGEGDPTIGPGRGIWSVSQPLQHTTRLAGQPQLRVNLTTSAPRANLVCLVYDISPDGKARVVSRGTRLIREAGKQEASLQLYGQDWVLQPGHRIGVLVTGSDMLWWQHVPTMSDVVVDKAEIDLPFLTRDRRAFLPGGPSPRLEEHHTQFATVDAETVRASERAFSTPGRAR